MQKEIDMKPTPIPYDITYYDINPVFRDNTSIYALYVEPKQPQ